jgi:hypothetical protein
MSRRRWRAGLAAVVGVLSITRAIIYFAHADDRPAATSKVTFDPTDGAVLPSGVTAGLPTATPTGLPTEFPTATPSHAPTEPLLGSVRYDVTGNGARVALVEYTTATLGVVDVGHPKVPYRKTVDGGIGEYFSVYAEASNVTTVTCEIVAHHGIVEKKQTAHGKHAHVSCKWDVPD